MAKAKTLNAKQQLFISAYIENGLNATKAAKAAGYSEKTAYSQGHRLLKNAEIKDAIAQELRKHAMPAEEVLYHLTAIARGDIHDLIDSNGNLDMGKAVATGKTNLIRKIRNKVMSTEDMDINEGEIEVYDRMDALKTLAKYHNLLTTHIKVDDWRSQAIQDIRDGLIDYRSLAQAFDQDLATELFTLAGKSVVVTPD